MSAIIDQLKKFYSQHFGERVMESSDFDRFLSMTKENQTTGCLEWIGPIRKRDGTPLMKVNRKQIAVRLTLFNIQFPMLKTNKVYGNSCGNSKCVAPEHAIHKKPSKPLMEKLQNYQLFGPMDCHFPENWNGKNDYHDIWHKDRKVGAHRAVYEYYRGEISKGYEIDHLCGNKPCSKIEHLEKVTHEENMRRAKAMGLITGPKTSGEEHANSKLNNAEFLDVQLSKNQGASTAKLMEEHEISRPYVSQIVRGGSRKNIKSLGRVTLRIDEEDIAKDSVPAERQITDEWAKIHIVQDGSEIAAYVKYQGSPKILKAIDQYLARAQIKFSRAEAA